MKYRVGDKVEVIIKDTYNDDVRYDIDKLPGRISTITEVFGDRYYVENLRWHFAEEDLKGDIDDPIHSRLEILDL